MNPYEQPPDSTTDQPPIAMDCGRHFIPASGLAVDLTCQECGVPPAGEVTRFQPLRGIARFYYARRPFGFPQRGGLRRFGF